MTTIIILNPMGTDVTPFVTGAAMVPQLLKGTIRKPGDTVITIPYVNQSGRQNVADGVEMLHAAILNAINNGATDILVFGYSEGCQIADWWLAKYGQSTPVDPAKLRFWLIANANRKYGGFVYDHPIFNAVGYTEGKPANTPYRVIDFTRQYDGVSDFPTAQPIQDALVGLQTVGSDQNAISGAMNAVSAVLADNVHKTAALNAISGLVLIHNIYLYVTLDDPANVSLTEGNITWVWSPTYPAPMLGLSTAFPSSDREKRLLIEQAYQRPVAIPMPNYGSGPAWGQPSPPKPAAPVTGWWVPLRPSRGHASGAYLFAGLGAKGLRLPRAAAAGLFRFGGAAVGARPSRAVAEGGSFGFTGGPAVGDDNVRQASAAGSYRFIGGPAVGSSLKGGIGSGNYVFAGGPASGRRNPKASGPGGYSFGGAAFGRKAPRAAAGGGYLFGGSSVGRKTPRSVAAGAYNFAASAVAKTLHWATAAGGYNFAGTATGVKPPTFQPFNEVNANKTGTTPLDAAGVWVTIVAPGGGGGRGFYTPSSVGRGGGGGAGGGARISRVFIPISQLGSTYTINWAAGAASQTDGATITFSSGNVVLTAVGGKKGANGGSGAGGAGGAGGTASFSGITGVTTAAGANGGAGAPDNNSTGVAGGNNAIGGGPGGGGGSGLGAFGGTAASGRGGNSTYGGTTRLGGAAASALNPGNAGANGTADLPGGGGSGGAALNGNVSGFGGKGGTAGAGGGGSSGNADPNAQGAPGGQGGDAYTLLEWVATAA